MIDRQGFNREIVRTLTVLVEENPHLRFGQILQAYDFVIATDLGFNGGDVWENEFYEEPDTILNRVRAAIERMKK